MANIGDSPTSDLRHSSVTQRAELDTLRPIAILEAGVKVTVEKHLAWQQAQT
jgi:hypothetical protein